MNYHFSGSKQDHRVAIVRCGNYEQALEALQMGIDLLGGLNLSTLLVRNYYSSPISCLEIARSEVPQPTQNFSRQSSRCSIPAMSG